MAPGAPGAPPHDAPCILPQHPPLLWGLRRTRLWLSDRLRGQPPVRPQSCLSRRPDVGIAPESGSRCCCHGPRPGSADASCTLSQDVPEPTPAPPGPVWGAQLPESDPAPDNGRKRAAGLWSGQATRGLGKVEGLLWGAWARPGGPVSPACVPGDPGQPLPEAWAGRGLGKQATNAVAPGPALRLLREVARTPCGAGGQSTQGTQAAMTMTKTMITAMLHWALPPAPLHPC